MNEVAEAAQEAKSQKQKILEHLKSGKTLTPIEALMKFQCFRLAARIYDLRNDGHDIRTVDDNPAVEYAKYKLEAV